ncbi:hypothetical protein FJ251_00700 [bacterium]|nr:hypothetical protein [bacterium]
MKRELVILACIACTAAGRAHAHGVRHAVSHASAVVVTIRHVDGAPLVGAQYRMFAPGADSPFQSGRTDAAGRVGFLPDRPGEWRLTAASEDGHGADIAIAIDSSLAVPLAADSTVAARPPLLMIPGSAAAAKVRPLWDRAAPIVAGVGLLFGLFGVVVLFARRR